MKITKVTPMVMGTAWRNLTFVKVETDEGLEGVGEVRVVNRTEAVLGYLAEAVPRYVLGSDPFETEKLVQRMLRDDYMRAGDIVGSGISLIEMACWDIVGKALNLPVYRLLGGAVRDKIKAYANGWYTVERTPEEFHAAARRVVAIGLPRAQIRPVWCRVLRTRAGRKAPGRQPGGSGARRGWAGRGDPVRDARPL